MSIIVKKLDKELEPGSSKAREKDCSCPVIQRRVLKPGNGYQIRFFGVIYDVDPECPLHGEKSRYSKIN